jgi:hypothetical protein
MEFSLVLVLDNFCKKGIEGGRNFTGKVRATKLIEGNKNFLALSVPR